MSLKNKKKYYLLIILFLFFNSTFSYSYYNKKHLMFSNMSFDQKKINENVITIKGMKIEKFCKIEKSIDIVTTGAIFNIRSNGIIELYQRIGNKRKIAEVHVSGEIITIFDQEPSFNGYDYEWSGDNYEKQRIIISGDSTLKFYNIKKIKIVFFFNPIHLKQNVSNNGVVALDENGGISIMPSDNPSLKSTTINKKKWELISKNPIAALFIGIAPARQYDWERSLMPIIHYCSHVQRYPTNKQIKNFSKFAKILELHQWVWKSRYVNNNDCKEYNNCDGNKTPLWYDESAKPTNNVYIPDNETELKRVVCVAHNYGMLIAVYLNGIHLKPQSIISEAKRLKKEFKIDGVYLDGLVNYIKNGPQDAYKIARGLRTVFGNNGWINFHDTHKGYFAPFIHSYMDFITTNEHNNFNRWNSTTYNISNAIGGHWPEIPYFMMNPSKNIKDARDYLKALVDISLKFNNRLLFLIGEEGQWRFWRLNFTEIEIEFLKQYYLGKLKNLKMNFPAASELGINKRFNQF